MYLKPVDFDRNRFTNKYSITLDNSDAFIDRQKRQIWKLCIKAPCTGGTPIVRWTVGSD